MKKEKEERRGRGEETLLKKGFLSPSWTSPSPPKTFEWWGGRTLGCAHTNKE